MRGEEGVWHPGGRGSADLAGPSFPPGVVDKARPGWADSAAEGAFANGEGAATSGWT